MKVSQANEKGEMERKEVTMIEAGAEEGGDEEDSLPLV